MFFTYLSLSMSGWLLRPMCCVSVRRDYGSVSGFVGLFVCIFAASCLVSKITKLGGKCEESWVVNYALNLRDIRVAVLIFHQTWSDHILHSPIPFLYILLFSAIQDLVNPVFYPGS